MTFVYALKKSERWVVKGAYYNTAIKEGVEFLTAENEDLQAIITDGGWKCICSTDADITVEKIIETIPEA